MMNQCTKCHSICPRWREICYIDVLNEEKNQLTKINSLCLIDLLDILWSLVDTKQEDDLWYLMDWSEHLCLVHWKMIIITNVNLYLFLSHFLTCSLCPIHLQRYLSVQRQQKLLLLLQLEHEHRLLSKKEKVNRMVKNFINVFTSN